MRTVDATTRDNYDVRADVQAKAGVQARQSKARIFFATFMSKLTSNGGKPAQAPVHVSSDARQVGVAGDVAKPSRAPWFRRHCGAV